MSESQSNAPFDHIIIVFVIRTCEFYVGEMSGKSRYFHQKKRLNACF